MLAQEPAKLRHERSVPAPFCAPAFLRACSPLQLFLMLVCAAAPGVLQEGAGNAVSSAYVEVVFDNSDGRFPVRRALEWERLAGWRGRGSQGLGQGPWPVMVLVQS